MTLYTPISGFHVAVYFCTWSAVCVPVSLFFCSCESHQSCNKFTLQSGFKRWCEQHLQHGCSLSLGWMSCVGGVFFFPVNAVNHTSSFFNRWGCTYCFEFSLQRWLVGKKTPTWLDIDYISKSGDCVAFENQTCTRIFAHRSSRAIQTDQVCCGGKSTPAHDTSDENYSHLGCVW